MPVVSFRMAQTRNSKSKRPVPVIRGILAGNVTALRDRVYADRPDETARNRALAEKAGVSPSQVQRVVNGELGTSIDIVEWLAGALGVRPQDLLTPYVATAMDAPP